MVLSRQISEAPTPPHPGYANEALAFSPQAGRRRWRGGHGNCSGGRGKAGQVGRAGVMMLGGGAGQVVAGPALGLHHGGRRGHEPRTLSRSNVLKLG